MKLKTIAAAAALSLFALGTANSEPVKVGMITTLSGGGAGLGIDVRDGFLLAVKKSGNKDINVIVEDDQRKPDIAVQLADKMIQSEVFQQKVVVLSFLFHERDNPNKNIDKLKDNENYQVLSESES